MPVTGTLATTSQLIATPVSIANGGTNASSMTTTDGVVYYDGTRLVTTTAGTAAQVLTSNGAGVAPTFQAAAGGGVTGPGSSTDRAVVTWNGAGGTALFNNSTSKISSTGIATNTAQPAFQLALATGLSNTSGGGTNYQVTFDTVNYDQASNTSGGNTFTAPVAGIYAFKYMLTLTNISVANTPCYVWLKKNGANFALPAGGAIGVMKDSGNILSVSFNLDLKLAAADALTFWFSAFGGTDTIGIQGANGGYGLTSFISGYLVC